MRSHFCKSVSVYFAARWQGFRILAVVLWRLARQADAGRLRQDVARCLKHPDTSGGLFLTGSRTERARELAVCYNI